MPKRHAQKFIYYCAYCNSKIIRSLADHNKGLRYRKTKLKYCSHRCMGASQNIQKTVQCLNCSKQFAKHANQVSKFPNHFCSCSCAATYNNKHKTHGTRRSKLEKYLEEQLTSLYPTFTILYNQKDAIQSELDIYIPSLNLAIELNGIFHYEPIYGEKKLEQIQNNDNRKFQACLEKKIELCIIDVSGLKYFKPANAEKYLKIVRDLLDMKRKTMYGETASS